MLAAERKQKIDEARRALREVDPRIVRAAMQALPADGSKSEALRAMLQERLRVLEGALKQGQPIVRPELARIDSDHQLALNIDELSSPNLFEVSVEGGRLEMTINALHPAAQRLRSSRGQVLDPTASLFVVAFAILEAEAGSERKRERIRELRADLSRVLARMTASTSK